MTGNEKTLLAIVANLGDALAAHALWEDNERVKERLNLVKEDILSLQRKLLEEQKK
jgi:hypothetical protein